MGRPEQRAVHAILLVVTLARMLGCHALDDGAIAMLVWNTLALVGLGRVARLPRAIALRGGGRHWRSMLPGRLVPLMCCPDPVLADIGQWRPLEPYVLESRPWI